MESGRLTRTGSLEVEVLTGGESWKKRIPD